MNWLTSTNNQIINIKDIPVIDISELRNDIIKSSHRVVGFFGKEEGLQIKLYIILADDQNSTLLVSSVIFGKNDSYESITQQIQAFHMFEREFYEEFKIEPKNHPWLKPIRNHKEDYPFFKMEGDEVHEVAVGPVHAGIIEPGHFRFMCNGEKIYELEIQLGYQYRNIEKLFLQNDSVSLAESIAGDTVIGNSLAYAKAIETLANIKVTSKASLIRVIALEMERIAVHVGDLGAISNDIAYLMGNSVFGATRTLVVNTLLEICGSRYGRGLIKIGGVNYDISSDLTIVIIKMLDKIEADIDRMVKAMFAASTVTSRLEKTGVLSNAKARDLGVVGMVARTSNLALDLRVDYPDEVYKELSLTKKTYPSGDVYARTLIRYEEIKQSVQIIKTLLSKLSCHKSEVLFNPKSSLNPDSMVVSMVEGWRGEVIHVAITDEKGKLSRYKIKDPSFNNWYGLAVAIRNNGISDFPLCNKSFNLSYCGNDL